MTKTYCYDACVHDLVRPESLMGSRRRTEVLVLLGLLGETYARELARLLGAPLYSVQGVLDRLERDGVIVARAAGRTRLLALNRRYRAHRELQALLLRLAESEPALRTAAASRRSRPRKKGKEL